MDTLDIKVEQNIESVEDFQFEPIKGQPMLNWRGKRPFTSTQFYPAQLKESFGEEVNGWMNKIFWGHGRQGPAGPAGAGESPVRRVQYR